MLKQGTLLNRLQERLEPAAKNRRVVDLRVGLSYVGVRLDHGGTGLAAVLPDASSGCCTVLPAAGRYAGSSAADLLACLSEGRNALERAMGLAAANALVEAPPDILEDREVTTYFGLTPGEKVAMVGLFSPLVKRIRATGATLTVIEKNPGRLALLDPDQKQQALRDCDVAMITATTLLNVTLEETIAALGSPRLVAVMGPSTPLLPAIFSGTPVTHLGGAVVADSARVLQIISEGGGTPALRPYLRFINRMTGA
ncbi:MAG: DUF364 domain-containing protein [Smithellaceae bacterium]|nr:DUF364 domain-containing protein [Smithellaceae bacterium]